MPCGNMACRISISSWAYYEDCYRNGRRRFPTRCHGGYYKTIVSGAIETFGWDMLLEAAAYREEFEARCSTRSSASRCINSKPGRRRPSRRSSATTTMCGRAGRSWIRPSTERFIFPRYARTVVSLKQAGKKLIFCSDGTSRCVRRTTWRAAGAERLHLPSRSQSSTGGKQVLVRPT